MTARLLIITLLVCGCKTSTDCDAGNAILNSTLWMQGAAEYRASALQTYAVAQLALDAALGEPSTQPAAVILDLDETALDNSRYAAREIRKGKTFVFDDDWEAWVRESASGAIPGARDFLLYAASRGVTPFYITNRDAEEEAATRANLEKLGYPVSASEDTVLVRGERPEWNTFDKTPRREFVSSRHRVLLLLGDDLNDFTAASGKSVAERASIIESTRPLWGRQWFVLPNAIYGSWEGAVTGSAGTPCEQMQTKRDALKP